MGLIYLFSFQFLSPVFNLSFGWAEKSGGTKVEQHRQKASVDNLLPKYFPETAETASVRNLARVWNRHVAGLLMIGKRR